MVSNGALPASSLVALSTPGRLLAAPAASFERLVRATKTTGTEQTAEAYRDLAEQERVFRANYTTIKSQGDPSNTVANGGIKQWNGKTWYRKPGKATAAVPGTSNHGWGKAVDFQNLGKYESSTWKAFALVAPEHGWSNVEGKAANEPWHWVYNESNDQHKEDGVELNEKVTLSAAMKTMAGWTSDAMTVGNLLGYLSSSSWASGKTGKDIKSLLEKVSAQLDASLANQAETLKVLKSLTITADVSVPDFDITISGTATKKEEA